MVPIRTEACLAPRTLQGALGQSQGLRGTAELNVGRGALWGRSPRFQRLLSLRLHGCGSVITVKTVCNGHQ